MGFWAEFWSSQGATRIIDPVAEMASNDRSLSTPVSARKRWSCAAADNSVCPPLGASAAIQRRNRVSAAPSRIEAARWPAISTGFLVALATITGSRSGRTVPPPCSTACAIAATEKAGSIATRLPDRPANAAAQALAQSVPNRLLHPVEANELFIRLSAPEAARLRDAGFDFYDWGEGAARLVTNWAQDATSVAPLAVALRALDP